MSDDARVGHPSILVTFFRATQPPFVVRTLALRQSGNCAKSQSWETIIHCDSQTQGSKGVQTSIRPQTPTRSISGRLNGVVLPHPLCSQLIVIRSAVMSAPQKYWARNAFSYISNGCYRLRNEPGFRLSNKSLFSIKAHPINREDFGL